MQLLPLIVVTVVLADEVQRHGGGAVPLLVDDNHHGRFPAARARELHILCARIGIAVGITPHAMAALHPRACHDASGGHASSCRGCYGRGSRGGQPQRRHACWPGGRASSKRLEPRVLRHGGNHVRRRSRRRFQKR
jgi:hypothetical protein